MHILVKSYLVTFFVATLLPSMAFAQQPGQNWLGYLDGADVPEDDSYYWSYEFTNVVDVPGEADIGTEPQFANQEVSYLSADANGDGNVSVNELMGMLEGGKLLDDDTLALKETREARFAQTDSNGDGGVSLDELMELRRVLMAERGNADAPKAEERVRRVSTRIIGRIDTDNDGKISRTELALARSARVERVAKRVDSNGDGQISPEEWQAVNQ